MSGPEAGFGDQQDIWDRDGTLVRLTRGRCQSCYDMSRPGTNVWLDVDTIAAALVVSRLRPLSA